MLITNRKERQNMKYPITDKNIIIKHLGEILNDYNTKENLNKRIIIQSILRDYIYFKN
jgi:hypothetical protein